MQCPKCKGNVIKKDDIFECENCGAHFKGKSKKEQAEKIEEPTIPEVNEEEAETQDTFYDVSKEFSQESDPFKPQIEKEYEPENDVYSTPSYDEPVSVSHDSLAQYVKKNPRDPEGFYEKAYDYIKDNSSVSDNTYRSILNIALNNADPNYVESYVAKVNKLIATTKKKKTEANIYKNVTASNGVPMPKRIPIATETRPQKNSIQGIMAKVGKSIPQSSGASKSSNTSVARAPRQKRQSTVSRGKSFMILGMVLAYIAVVIVGFITIRNNVFRMIFISAMILVPLIVGLIVVAVRRRKSHSSSGGLSKKKKIIIACSTLGAVVAAGAVLLIGAIPTINYRQITTGSSTKYSTDSEKIELNNYSGTFSNGDYVVCGVKGLFMPFHFNMSDVVIPAKVGNGKVVSIDSYAFASNKSLKKVTLGENIKYVGYGAFAYCSNLVTVNLNANVEKIEADAFDNTTPTINYPYSEIDLQNVFNNYKKYDVRYSGNSKSGSGSTTVPTSQYFSTSNDAKYPWYTTSNSITSTNRVNSSSSYFRFTFTRSGTFKFDVSVSSQSGDYFTIAKNNVEQTAYRYSGTSAGRTGITITVSAGDSIEFRYVKDSTGSGGTDQAMVSNISFTTGSTTPTTTTTPSTSRSSSTSNRSSSSTRSSATSSSNYFNFYNNSGSWELMSENSTSALARAYDNSVSSTSFVTFEFNQSGTALLTLAANTTSSNYCTVEVNGYYLTDVNGGSSFSHSISVSTGTRIVVYYYRNSYTTSSNYHVDVQMSFTPQGAASTSSTRSTSSNGPTSSYFYTTNDSTYPWAESYNSIQSTNKASNSSSAYRFTFTASGTFTFDEYASSESSCDLLKVYKNGSLESSYSLSGNSQYKTNNRFNVLAGDYIEFRYVKDGSTNSYDDLVQVNSISFTPNSSYTQSSTTSSSSTSSTPTKPTSDYFTTRNDSTYPWTETATSITSTNKANNSTSTYRFTFNETGKFTFDIDVSTETGCDFLRVYKNGSELTQYKMSGTVTQAENIIDVVANDYIEFKYVKDHSMNGGNDRVSISNILFVKVKSGVTGFENYFYTVNDATHPWMVIEDGYGGDLPIIFDDFSTGTSSFIFNITRRGTISFYISSNLNSSNIARVYVNGTQTDYYVNSTTSVVRVSLSVSAYDEVEVRYTKNNSTISQNNGLSIGQISFTPSN